MSYSVRKADNRDLENSTVVQVTKLINGVYEVAEDGMWNSGFRRVEENEVSDFIRKENLIFAENNSQIVGSVFVTKLDNGSGEFGMLVCDPKFRHMGIGKSLINAAESHCRSLGCTQMQLELLYPKEWKQQTKEILKVWYPSLGYVKGDEADFGIHYPQLVDVLATECVFAIYTKQLV